MKKINEGPTKEQRDEKARREQQEIKNHKVSLCQRPQEILFATFNHLDSLIKYSTNDPELNARTVSLFKQFVGQYAQLTPGQFQLLRATLLSYFQDQHVRVSIFLKDGLQNDKGRFVLPLVGTVPLGVEVPGAIRVHREPASTMNFKCLGTYQSFNKIPSLEIGGVRATKLGLNIYSTSSSAGNKQQNNKSEMRQATENKDGGEGELSLLANLLGTTSSAVSGTLKIDLFNDHYLDMEPAKEASSAPLTKSDSGGIRIDVKRGDRSTLLNIANDFGELSVNKEDNVSKGEDLLSLMDTLDSD
ncbi:hypothetical protein ACHWQZ_G010849 [Mnemiopsis leidyi]